MLRITLLLCIVCLASALEMHAHRKHTTAKHKHQKTQHDGMQEGDMVEVTGSTASSGKRGMLEEFDEDKEKWLVRFVDGRGVFFRQTSLKAAPKHKKKAAEQEPDSDADEDDPRNLDKLPKSERKMAKPLKGELGDDDELDWQQKEANAVHFRKPKSTGGNVLKHSKKVQRAEAEDDDFIKKIVKEKKDVESSEKQERVASKKTKVEAKEGKATHSSKSHSKHRSELMAGFREKVKKDVAKPEVKQKKESKPNAAAEGGLGYYLAPLYKQAAREEGFSERVPGWPLLFKYPRSWVEKIEKIPVARHPSTYNFIGSFYKNAATKNARGWVIDFVKRRFSENDFFKITGPLDNHELLGAFDHSFDKSKASYPYENFNDPDYVAPFDENYFKAMKNSKFTLCPAGDGPWSIRFFEAMLVGSIPIVEKEKHIIGMEGPKMSRALNWKYYLLSDDPNHQYEYRPDWVKENREKFLKYFTFIHGNNKFSAAQLARTDKPLF